MRYANKRVLWFSVFSIYLTLSGVIGAQESNQRGYVITTDGDTLRGYIQNVNINQFVLCSFKTDINSKVINYLPGEIQAYRFDDNGKFFVSKEVPMVSGKKVLFLEYLIKGKANIYFRRDDTDHYYIQKEGDGLTELTEPPVLTKDEEGVLYFKPQKYTGKLKYVLSDCPDLFDEIDEIKLYPNQLIKLAKDYHDKVCDSSKCIVFERKISPVKFHFGVLTGISYNDFYFNPQNYTDKQFSEFFGLRAEISNLFFSVERITLNTGLIIQHYSNYNFHRDVYIYKGVVYTKDNVSYQDMNATTIKIPLTFNYVFTQSKLRPYINIGVTGSFYLARNKELYITDYSDYYGQAIPFYHMGIIGTVGFKYLLNKNRIFFIEFNAEKQQNMNMNYMLRLQNSYVSAQFGILF